MRRIALLGLAAVTAALTFAPATASAQGGYKLYPYCAYYNLKSGVSNCYFSTLAQCRAAISGVGGTCGINPFYAAYGSYYSFGDAARRPGRYY